MAQSGHPSFIPATPFVPAADALPGDFRPAGTGAARLPHLDRQLGYFGAARYVAFRYEPRGEEVVWDDGQSSGFGTGGWQAFLDEVAPAAAACGANVGTADGTTNPATHVLLIDRASRQAFFAERHAAEAFLAWQGRPDGANAA